jgi:hypothetical protein
VQCIGGTITATLCGTVRWEIEDDDGVVHQQTIPGTYYNPNAEYKLYSPQHVAQVYKDHHPKPHGTWCATYDDSVVLQWDQRRFTRTVPLDKKRNVALIRSAAGYQKFTAFCNTVCEGEPLVAFTHTNQTTYFVKIPNRLTRHKDGIPTCRTKQSITISTHQHSIAMGRAMLLHAAHRWLAAVTANLWPYAVRMANDSINNSPQVPTGLSPMERFTQVNVAPHVRHSHTFGCPVYVLDAQLQTAGGQIEKWKERSRVGLYLGASPRHSKRVALVLNLQTGHVSPQFHVTFDDNFDFDPDHSSRHRSGNRRPVFGKRQGRHVRTTAANRRYRCRKCCSSPAIATTTPQQQWPT